MACLRVSSRMPVDALHVAQGCLVPTTACWVRCLLTVRCLQAAFPHAIRAGYMLRVPHLRCTSSTILLLPVQVLNYGQSIFEGMKAQRTPQGTIVLFR